MSTVGRSTTEVLPFAFHKQDSSILYSKSASYSKASSPDALRADIPSTDPAADAALLARLRRSLVRRP